MRPIRRRTSPASPRHAPGRRPFRGRSWWSFPTTPSTWRPRRPMPRRGPRWHSSTGTNRPSAMRDVDVTQALAAYSLSDAGALPQPVVRQTGRAFLNYVGCALGGVAEPASVLALAQANEFTGARTASVIGRAGKLDAQHAALVNCLQSSIQTFDDTHLASVIHPTGPVAAAAMALLQHRPELAVDGAGFLAALAFGVELSCRVASVLTTPA